MYIRRESLGRSRVTFINAVAICKHAYAQVSLFFVLWKS